MTQAVQATNAAQCYQLGLEAYERKHFLDALVMLESARRLSPDNEDYQAACERIRALALSLGGWFSKKPTDPNLNSGGFWSDCFCECCGECCAEGCAEGCGELCSNCDCDCDCG